MTLIGYHARQVRDMSRPVDFPACPFLLLRCKVGWSHLALQQAQFQQYNVDPGFIGSQEGPGVKARLINLIGAVRTVMRSEQTMLLTSMLNNS